MPIEIRKSGIPLSEYEKVSIAFEVRSRLLPVGSTLIEQPFSPYITDYDRHEAPSTWPDRFDLSSWGIFSAFKEGEIIGGAVAVSDEPEVDILDGRSDLACIWDLRVDRSFRRAGIGNLLFKSVIDWARDRNCTELKVETQDINVPACRFYARQGCELRSINKNVYPPDLDEIQFLWYLNLRDAGGES